MRHDLRVSDLRWRRLRNFVLLTLGAIGCVALAYHLVSGGMFLLNAHGVVTREHVAIAAPFQEVRIREVFVHAGQRVEAGQRIAAVDSTSVFISMSALIVERARLMSRLSEIEARLAAVKALLPAAEAAAQQVQVFLERISKENVKGVVSDKTLTDTVSANYSASDKLLSLRAEQAALEQQMAPHRDALQHLTACYESLRQGYNEGILYTPVAGNVGSKVGAPGAVLSPGSNVVAEVYTGASFVLAYLSDRYLLNIEVGQRVRVQNYTRSVVGIVQELLPVTDAVPPEFQTPDKARERGQLVRVSIPSSTQFPLGEKIKLSNCYFGSCGGTSEFKEVVKRLGHMLRHYAGHGAGLLSQKPARAPSAAERVTAEAEQD